MNAFKYDCSVDGENFCARPELSKSLSNYVESGQNLVIQGERRIGKTSLVKETVASMRGWSILYADFMGVRSVPDVCNRIADALARFDSSDSFMRKIFAALVHLRPVATIDAMTGLPTISVDTRAASDPSSVNTVMNAVSSMSFRISLTSGMASRCLRSCAAGYSSCRIPLLSFSAAQGMP